MSREYSLSRIKDALEACDGNSAQAQRMIMGWLERDQSLMIGLVAPHLKSIVSHAVDYVANHPEKPAKPAESPLSVPMPEGDATGTGILETLLGQEGAGGPKFGNFDEPHSRPGKASSAHIDAIHKIARKITRDE